jgi:phosphatidylserine synthase
VITTGVQALAGVLLPSATVFLLLLCNDKDVLGPWVNRTWLNLVAAFIVSILLMMSLILMATTMFSNINVTKLSLVLAAALVAGYIVAGSLFAWSKLKHPAQARPVSTEARETWRMPALSLLDRPKWSRGRLTGMYLLRGYLVVAVVMLLIKAVELGTHK